jgi:hypothetical protein
VVDETEVNGGRDNDDLRCRKLLHDLFDHLETIRPRIGAPADGLAEL